MDHVGGNVSNDISSESTHQIHSPKFFTKGKVFTKVDIRIVKFQILNVWQFSLLLFFLAYLTL